MYTDYYKIYVKKILAFTSTYHYDTCVEFCFKEDVSILCRCLITFHDFGDKNMKLCQSESEKNCMKNNTITKAIRESCRKKCPYECTTKTYDYLITYNKLDPYFSNLYKNEFNLKKYSNQRDFIENLDKNMLSVSFSLNSMTYTRLREIPAITIIDLGMFFNYILSVKY